MLKSLHKIVTCCIQKICSIRTH